VVGSFIELLSTEPDTFVIKKHRQDTAWEVMKKAREVRDGVRDISVFDPGVASMPGSIQGQSQILSSHPSISLLEKDGPGLLRERNQRGYCDHLAECGPHGADIPGTRSSG